MLKVLHVIDSGGLYGAERVVLSLIETQSNLDVLPGLLSLGLPSDGPKEIEKEAKKRYIFVSSLRVSKKKSLTGGLQILRYAREWGANIIHSHGYKGDILLGFLPRRIRNISVITTVHGWTSTHFFNKVKFYQLLSAFAMKNFDAVTAVSENILNYPLFKCIGIRPFLIENGLPRLSFREGNFEKKYPILAEKCKGTFKLLAVGRLSPEKGFDVLLRAFYKIVGKYFLPTLVIFGEGKQREELEELINELHLNERVFLPGYCKNAYSFFPFFDAFILPSRSEGLPISLLEAMQAGIPIVATRVGQVPKVLGNGDFGSLVDREDIAGLASAIEAIYRNRKEARVKALAARNRALNEYSSEKMASRYLSLYDYILSKTNR